LAEYRDILKRENQIVPGRRSASNVGRRVSVISPVRNAARTLEATMRALGEQTYPNIEYILTVGKSTDNTPEIIEANDAVVSYKILGGDRGPGDAVSKGIALASGDFIALLMGDDWWEPDFLTAAITAAEASGADFVYGQTIRHYPDGSACRFTPPQDYRDRILRGDVPIDPRTLVLRRAIFEEIGVFSPKFVINDVHWLIHAIKKGARGVYEPRMVAHARAAGGMTSRFTFRLLREGCLMLASTGASYRTIGYYALSAATIGMARNLVTSMMSPRSYNKLVALVRGDRRSMLN
jgi:glycosyltransferase involved in cell wall biosynthesis